MAHVQQEMIGWQVPQTDEFFGINFANPKWAVIKMMIGWMTS